MAVKKNFLFSINADMDNIKWNPAAFINKACLTPGVYYLTSSASMINQTLRMPITITRHTVET